jgi:hypothetical protein
MSDAVSGMSMHHAQDAWLTIEGTEHPRSNAQGSGQQAVLEKGL